MKKEEFTATCPYEVGDEIAIAKVINGEVIFAEMAKITDIACTHYVRSRRVEFTYELDNCGQYVPLTNLKGQGIGQ